MELLYAPVALEDLDSIEEYIGETSMETAIRIGDSLRQCCTVIAENPQIGLAYNRKSTWLNESITAHQAGVRLINSGDGIKSHFSSFS